MRGHGDRGVALVLATAAGICLVLMGVAFLLRETRDVGDADGLSRRYATSLEDSVGARADEGDIDWASLRSVDPNVCAWLRMSGAGIDLPVCRATDEDPTFYLRHALGGEGSLAGVPFLDHRSEIDDTCLVVYGHHLALVGGMFSNLARTYEQGGFDAMASDATWLVPDKAPETFVPLCALRVNEADGSFLLFGSVEQASLRSWLSRMLERSSARADPAEELVEDAERCLMLVTCSSDVAGGDQRTVLLLVRQGELPETETDS